MLSFYAALWQVFIHLLKTCPYNKYFLKNLPIVYFFICSCVTGHYSVNEQKNYVLVDFKTDQLTYECKTLLFSLGMI